MKIEVIETLYSYNGTWEHERSTFPLITALIQPTVHYKSIEYYRAMIAIIVKIVDVVNSYDLRFKEPDRELWYKDFWKRFDGQCLCKAKREPLKFNKKELIKIRISLERAILITLAIEYQKDESKTFTTTEISYLINKYFKAIERSKNNVSRYFNQAYYVYYEVKYINRRNRYKISPIGYSEALMILRNLKRMPVELE